MNVLSKLLKSLKKSLFLKQILTLSSGNAISYLFGLAAIPILSRVYEKDAFEVLALYTSIISIAGVVIALQYNQALVRAETEVEAVQLAKWAINSSLIFSVIIFIIGLSLRGYFSQKYEWFGLLFISSITVGSLVASLHVTAMQFMNRLQEYKSMRNVKASFTAISMIFQVSLNGVSPLFGLVHGQWAGKVIGSYSILKSLIKKIFLNQSTNKVIEWKTLFIKNINFQRYQLPAVLIDRVSSELPVILISIYVESHLADFSMAMRVILIPASIMSVAYGQVFYRRSSELIHAGYSIRPFLLKTWFLMGILVIIPVSILFFFGPELFSFVLGQKWYSSGELASILAVLSAIIFIGSSTSTGFQSLNKQSVSLVLVLIGLFYKFGIFYFGLHYFDFQTTIKLYVAVHSIGVILNQIVLYIKS